MHISGQERRKLRDALIDAFPNKSSLEQMLSFQLNKKLDQIALGDDLNTVVFNLIKKSEAQNWIQELIYAAHNSNSGNSSLKAIAVQLLSNYHQANISLINRNLCIEKIPIDKKSFTNLSDIQNIAVKKNPLNQKLIIPIPQSTTFEQEKEASKINQQHHLPQHYHSSSQIIEQKIFPSLPTFTFTTIKLDSTGNIIEHYPNKKARFFKEDLGNGITLEMVYIPGGSFHMGSPPREKDQNKDEQGASQFCKNKRSKIIRDNYSRIIF